MQFANRQNESVSPRYGGNWRTERNFSCDINIEIGIKCLSLCWWLSWNKVSVVSVVTFIAENQIDDDDVHYIV